MKFSEIYSNFPNYTIRMYAVFKEKQKLKKILNIFKLCKKKKVISENVSVFKDNECVCY